MAEKSTDMEIEERISLVFRLRLQGFQNYHILQHPSVLAWSVTPRQVHNYITEAKKRLLELNQETQEQALADIVSMHLENYALADIKDRTAILREIARLRGLEEIHLNVKVSRPLKTLTDEELEKALGATEP